MQDRFFSNDRSAEELYDLNNDPFEVKNLVKDSNYSAILAEYSSISKEWIAETNDKGQYHENKEGLKLMFGIQREYAVNPEYEILREEFKNLAGSQFYLKSEKYQKIID